MTTYILVGGADIKGPGYWDKLPTAIDLEPPIKVLSCQFAQPKDEWQERFESFKPYFEIAFGDDMIPVLAIPNLFKEQAKNADVIYLHGGNTRTLKSYMDKIEDVETLFEGKVVIGSSAGAQFLGQTYWSCGARAIGKGSGIVPVNTIVHYGSDYGASDERGPIDWEKAKEELQMVLGDARITLLPERKFIVFKK